MAVKVPSASAELILGIVLDRNLVVRLYSVVDGGSIDALTVVGDFTEVTTGGYAGLTLTSGGWVIDTTSLTQGIYDSANPQEWVFTETTTVTGYYVVTTAATSALFYAESLTGGAITFTGGGTFELIPVLEANEA